ncbi:Eukaryotic initiation factor iso-4F subunit p82-34 [Tetrabaena socialis]|uniref:Eukaryotic initiation factor iso-4F subunit p82-34 n=1 Tax=Tetrabaena socialis TaxID=47790 RepID=A0A2J8AJT0_9CHLO|nr:Eukaryotic initiation factor iso-4F subunit p82-34 [Tetrabaena socialis]|eukprot:PNH12771.1 Eukaryotic initiation factor iso-4F subunit p82-34 [Tetrabaena socialis]
MTAPVVDEAADGEVSLRPLAKGGANPFAVFGKGLGYGIKGKKASSSAYDDKPKKKNSERIRYAKDYLLKFMEKYNSCPSELEQQNLEIVVSGEDRVAQQEVLQASACGRCIAQLKVAEEIDDRDWRTRTSGSNREAREDRDFREQPKQQPREVREPAEARPARPTQTRQEAPAQAAQAAPAPSASAPEQQSQPARAERPAATFDKEDMRRIAKAEDVGRQAYRVGGSITSEEKAVRSVKGILNKLTPEKFDRLLNQLLEVITTADVLQKTIALVFENAVEQPTYVAMYGDLCVSLSKELPQFPPPPGEDKPLSFRQILLNTCQDEFEAAADAREDLASISDQDERDAAERAVKKRVLGNMRLISELYKQDMVKDWIMVTCIDELLTSRATKASKTPPEDNIEVLSDDEVARKAQSLFEEFVNTLDKAEATTCVRELGSHLAKVVELGLDFMLNSLKDKEQDALLDLLLHVHEAGAITSEHVVDALTTFTTQLEDLSMDIPKAPQLLGRFYGSCVCRSIASLDLLPQLMEGDASVEPKRRFSGSAFKAIRAAKGDPGLASLCKDVGLAAGSFLASDPEFDKDEPALEAWLKAEGLTGIVPV